jgi:hypothetical protein
MPTPPLPFPSPYYPALHAFNSSNSSHGRPAFRQLILLSLGLMIPRLLSLIYFLAAAGGEPWQPPALEKLNSLVGVWDLEVTSRFAPNEEPFKGRVFDTTRWSDNKEFLISEQWVLLPAGWLPKLIITCWDPMTGQFRQTNVLPNATYVNILKTDGPCGQRYSESEKDGHVTRTWTTIEDVSPGVRKMKSESSIDNGPHWVSSEGTSRKKDVASPKDKYSTPH